MYVTLKIKEHDDKRSRIGNISQREAVCWKCLNRNYLNTNLE